MIIAFGTLTKEKTERKKLSFFNILSYDVWVCVVLLCVAHVSILSKLIICNMVISGEVDA